jgi:hypothetical protein
VGGVDRGGLRVRDKGGGGAAKPLLQILSSNFYSQLLSSVLYSAALLFSSFTHGLTFFFFGRWIPDINAGQDGRRGLGLLVSLLVV